MSERLIVSHYENNDCGDAHAKAGGDNEGPNKEGG